MHYYEPNDGEFVCDFSHSTPMLMGIDEMMYDRGQMLETVHWFAFRLFKQA